MQERIPGADPEKNSGPPVGDIQPSPVPATFVCEVVSSSKGPLLRFTFKTPVGSHITYYLPDEARHIANLIAERAAIAGRALLLPPGTVMPMPDEPEAN